MPVIIEPNIIPPVIPADYQAVYVTPAELVRILLSEHERYILSFAYQTDLLADDKTLVSAKEAFPNGLYRHRRLTANVSYDYDAKVQRRSEGAESAKGGPTWQLPLFVIEDGTGRECFTPFSLHRDDVDGFDDDGLPIFNTKKPRVYFRYEPPTEAQQSTNFCANDYDYYADTEGNLIAAADVEQHYPNKKKGLVKHRTLRFDNAKRVYFKQRVMLIT
jgi:hypothetical protein